MGHQVKLSDQKKEWFKRGKLKARPHETRAIRERILIVCEGSKTEPNYFKSINNALPPNVVEISVEGEGFNTQSLVNRAKEYRDQKANSDYPYDETWVVFDKDSFGADQFDNAIHSAEAAGIKVAWSNEAFELWYILHFEARQTGMSRSEYSGCLATHLASPYKKNDPDMYSKLQALGDEDQARERAKSLQDVHADVTSHSANPCTCVNKLVEKLNTFKPITK